VIIDDIAIASIPIWDMDIIKKAIEAVDSFQVEVVFSAVNRGK